MDDSLLKFALTALTTLFVVVDPLGVLPIFISLTRSQTPEERRQTLNRAVAFGLGTSLVFLFAGHAALAYLGVTVHAFAISGGILLFATAMPMLFGQRPALQSSEPREGGSQDVAIFPLAIPLLAGPGAITTILLLASQARGSAARLAFLALTIGFVFLLTKIVLGLAGEQVVRRLSTGGIHVATRILGILLAALAVQFVLNGVSDYIRVLQAGANR